MMKHTKKKGILECDTCGFWKRGIRVIYETLECHFTFEASAEANENRDISCVELYNVEKEMENEAQSTVFT